MGMKWDTGDVAFDPAFWAECLRVLKPGAHLMAFGGTRTYHRLACAIEDAGFEIRDQFAWVYGSGFPKSHAVGDGWGTAVKPAWEPICFARKPLIGTVAANVMAHGTGAINIDGCRVPGAGGGTQCNNRDENGKCLGHKNAGRSTSGETFHGRETDGGRGRFPANIQHDGDVFPPEVSRFFYCAKASKRDREEGLDAFETKSGNTWGDGIGHASGSDGRANHHPTVKPTDLMRYYCRLITPPGGIVLDPFAGSGSTGKAAILEGFGFIGFELDADYAKIAQARIDYAVKSKVTK
jgi:site-specific DNA-methyltransferase (adenine-specific)